MEWESRVPVSKDRLALKKAGIECVDELLNHFPKRYEDRTRFDPIPTQAMGTAVCFKGLVLDFRTRRFGGRKQFSEAVIVTDAQSFDFGGKATLRWFNMPYLSNMIAAGQQIVVYGKPKEQKGAIVIDHPEFEIVSEEGDSIHIGRIVPIYPNISGINQRKLRELIWHACSDIESLSLRAFLHPHKRHDRAETLSSVHFPSDLDEVSVAKREFALEEFFLLQLNVLWQRQTHQQDRGIVQGKSMALLKDFYDSLPFDLTNAQKRSVKELIADMRNPFPMNRLLQGDVGSGKTFVAMCAMLLSVDSGYQAALMAPTQILAEQHYLTFKKWLEPLDVRISLHTGSREEQTHYDLHGQPQIIIGTHALLYDKVKFEKLGLVVIDEQHRFGVEQRKKLIDQGVSPDVLVMTATPIPRTLTLTLYGDHDVSILDEKPAGRGKIITGVRQKPKVTEVTKFLKEQLEEGRQAYIVYPLVEESSVKARSATEEFEKWQKRLTHFEVELLHGKIKADEKDAIMTRFRDHKTDVLISTTVIEVGVDVPNANIMIIYDAERFGLAQLHQLRGRVGRGEHKSYCILITNSKEQAALDKLAILAKTDDGFVISEEDLKLRGPGEVLGTAQSGRSELKFVDFLADTALIRQARSQAEEVLAKDPELSRNHHLRPYLLEHANLTGSY